MHTQKGTNIMQLQELDTVINLVADNLKQRQQDYELESDVDRAQVIALLHNKICLQYLQYLKETL